MYIKVHVFAGAKKELVTAKGRDAYTISVREPAERNMANRRVSELLASERGISVKMVRIVSGHHSPSKIFSIRMDDY